MPFRVRRRSLRDGSRRSSLPRCSGDSWALFTSPLGLACFEATCRVSPHRTILCATAGCAPVCRATALVSFSVCSGPLPSGLGLAECWQPRSPAGAHSPESVGDHPDTSTPSATGPCSRTPPRSWRSPRHRWRNLCRCRDRSRRSRRTCRAGRGHVAVSRRVVQRVRPRASLRARRSVKPAIPP